MRVSWLSFGAGLLSLWVLAGCGPDGPAPGAGAPPPQAPAGVADGLLPVHRVLDGDTIELAIEGEVVRIRLKGINTPEKGECLADEASEVLRRLSSDGVVLIERGRGDHGRVLGYLETGSGTLIQEVLVESGLALAYPYGDPDEFSPRLASAQERAESARRGQFDPAACGVPERAAGEVEVASIDANPAGSDLEPGAGESVTLTGPPNLAVGGWTLKDTSASHRLRFPEGTRLGPDGRLVVYSSCGSAEPGRIFWCKKGSAVWNNSGDTAFLLGPKGNLVSYREWSRD